MNNRTTDWATNPPTNKQIVELNNERTSERKIKQTVERDK